MQTELEAQTPNSVRLSEISMSDSKIDDFHQVGRIESDNDFASYFALTRITKKIQDSFIQSNDPKAQFIKETYSSIKLIRKLFVTIYILMTIFQKPIWCNPTQYSNDCQYELEQGYQIPAFLTFYIPVLAYYLIEIFLIISMIIFKAVKYYSFHTILIERKIVAYCFVMVGIFIISNDIIVIIYDNDYSYNISTLLKPIFLIFYSQYFLGIIMDYALIIYRGKEIYFMMIFSYVFFVGLGTAIFRNQSEISDIAQEEGICNSSGLPFSQKNYCTFLIMFQLQTTVNSPDIYLPYYGNRSVAVIYFIAYQFVNTILMINLILSLFYSQYKKLVEERTKSLLEKHRNKIQQFQNKVFRNKRSNSIVGIQKKQQQQQQDQTNSQFLIQRILDHWIFNSIMQILCIADFCFIFQDNTNRDIQIVNITLNSIMLIESIIIAILRDLKKIHKYPGVIFDFTISLILVILIIAIMALQQDSFTQDILIKVCCSIMSLRLFRGCTWLLKSKNFVNILFKIFSISTYLLQLFGTLIVTMTIFNAIGQLIFGGKINYNQQHINNYQWVNFNDFLSGFCTCWFLLIVNNWNLMSYDFSLSLQSDVIYLFFIFYYIIVVLLAQSVTIALLIEYLVNHVKDLGQSSEDETKSEISIEENYQNELLVPLQQNFKAQ
ncbi:unnamed protein product [Paramecium pentaurelia]|uniref:Ion transport domain-containing protein n=1 Tax=Paramecium pentaurelia TaxID=43138 RepID=A0A8S1SBP8_9CILI|nr:unnamed protein product [Paramecium pentaurelia]